MIERITDLPDDVLGFEAVGEVEADDYKNVFVPAIEAAVKDGGKARIPYVLGSRFDGYSAGAAWQDTKLGIEHLRAFERFAVVTDVDWVRHAVKAFGWMIPGHVRVFANSDRDAAVTWVGG